MDQGPVGRRAAGRNVKGIVRPGPKDAMISLLGELAVISENYLMIRRSGNIYEYMIRVRSWAPKFLLCQAIGGS